MSGPIGGDWDNNFTHRSRNLRVLDKYIMWGGRTSDITHPRCRSLFQIFCTVLNALRMDFQHNNDPFHLLSFNMDPFQLWGAVSPELEVGSQPTPEQAQPHGDRAVLNSFAATPSYPHISQIAQVLPEPLYNFRAPPALHCQQMVSHPVF